MEKNVTIIGAGLVGSLWAVYLSRAGYKVTIYERRSDIRKAEISAGKSINLALSVRGWKALDAVGVGDAVREIAIPMSGRVMHDTSGQLLINPTEKRERHLFSFERKINATMMDIAEKHGNAIIHYNHECQRVDFENSIAFIRNTDTGEELKVKSDLIFAADGAFSAIRYNSCKNYQDSIIVSISLRTDTEKYFFRQMKMVHIRWIKMPFTYGPEVVS